MTQITIETTTKASLENVWTCWTQPEHITQWNFASDDWHCPRAQNDVRAGGTFSARMESKDGKMGFDFGGTYDEVIPHEKLVYHLGDGRKVEVLFSKIHDNETLVTETFDAEAQNSIDMQKKGWQSILENFKKHVETEHA